jgi:hypothetical protein
VTVQSPIERACHASSAIDDVGSALVPVQRQLRELSAECWMIATLYLASIGSGVFAAFKLF